MEFGWVLFFLLRVRLHWTDLILPESGNLIVDIHLFPTGGYPSHLLIFDSCMFSSPTGVLATRLQHALGTSYPCSRPRALRFSFSPDSAVSILPNWNGTFVGKILFALDTILCLFIVSVDYCSRLSVTVFILFFSLAG
jgi:hypothetical protein